MLLLNSAYEQTGLQSIKALKSHTKKKNIDNEDKQNETIYLMITSDKPVVKRNDHIPRIIQIPSKFGKIRDKRILLITKDPTMTYRKQLEVTDSDTEHLFKGIYGLKKFLSRMHNKRYQRGIYNDYDVIMADQRIHHKLFDVLGKNFYQKNKKVPYMIQMNSPEKLEQFKKKKKIDKVVNKKTDAELDEEEVNNYYVYQQVKSILRNTTVVYTENGNTLSIKVGTTDMKSLEVMANMEAVVAFLTSEKYKLSGGFVMSFGPSVKADPKNIVKNRILNIHVKTSDSSSLPVYVASKDETTNDSGNNNDNF